MCFAFGIPLAARYMSPTVSTLYSSCLSTRMSNTKKIVFSSSTTWTESRTLVTCFSNESMEQNTRVTWENSWQMGKTVAP